MSLPAGGRHTAHLGFDSGGSERFTTPPPTRVGGGTLQMVALDRA